MRPFKAQSGFGIWCLYHCVNSILIHDIDKDFFVIKLCKSIYDWKNSPPFIGRHIQTGKNLEWEILVGNKIDSIAICVPYSLVFFCLSEIMQISHVLKMQMIWPTKFYLRKNTAAGSSFSFLINELIFPWWIDISIETISHGFTIERTW